MSKGEEPETPILEDAEALEEIDTSTEVEDSEDDWDEDGEGFEEDTDEETQSEEEDAEDESTEESDANDTDEDDSDDLETEEGSEESEEDDTSSGEQLEEKSKQEIAHEAFKRREAERKLREEQKARETERLENYLREAQGDEDELALRQQEVAAYQLMQQQVAVNQRALDVGIRQAVVDLKLTKMDEPTKQYLAKALDRFEAMNVVKDPNGNPVEVRGDVYQYLIEEMDSIRAFRDIGAREQTKRKAAEKTRTVTRPTRTPKETKIDPDLEAFDEEADKW